jgi:Tol biopolymer transport system component
MQGDFPPLPESVPAPVRSIVEKALEKDAADRYHTARDLVVDMRRVVRQSESAPTRSVDARPAPQRPSTRRSWTIGAAAAVIGVLAIGAAVLWRASRTGAPDNPLAGATFTRLADADGTESDAAISPDGKFVVFISHRSGRNDAWLSQVSTGEALNLTKGEVEIRRTPIRNMGFSADGSEVWIRSSPDAPSILMPLAGGHSRPFLRAGDADAAWSWDGSRLVVHGSVNGDPIFVAESTGANPRQIFVDRADVHNHFPIWSADGRWIYFVHGVQVTNEMDLWRIPSGGGPLERMTHHDSDVRYPTWLDAHTILYVSPDQDGSGPWLWALDTDRRTTRRVSVGLEKYTSIAGDARGDRLVATVANPTASLWSVPILDRMVEESDVRPYPVGTVRAFAPRFGGEALFYLSSHGAGDGLWKDVRGQANELWRGADTALLTPPAVSSDGSRVAIVVRQNAKLRLNVTDAGSSGFRTIAESIDIRGTAGWSPDQKWIVAGGIDEQGPALFKVPADGNSAPVRLAVGTARDPIWSPSGDLIVYTGDSVGGQSPLVGVRPDGTRVDLPRVTVAPGGERYRFTPDGRAVVYMVGAVEQDFWELDLTTKRNRQLARLGKSDAMRTFDVTPDGKTIVFDRLRENSDVVRIDLPKK